MVPLLECMGTQRGCLTTPSASRMSRTWPSFSKDTQTSTPFSCQEEFLATKEMICNYYHPVQLRRLYPGPSTATLDNLTLFLPKAGWIEYKMACEASGVRAAGLCSFRQHWRKLMPQIKVMKPMSDLCWECQQNSVAIMRAANLHISDKSEKLINKLTLFLSGGEEGRSTLGAGYQSP